MGKSFLKKGKGLDKRSKRIEIIEVTKNNCRENDEVQNFSNANGFGYY